MTTKQIRNKRVTAIPATKIPGHTTVQGTRRRRRVAAYARVSTEMEEQASSYEAQIDYYTSHIQSRTEWEFAGMYADEGITGTSTKHREGFKTMIADTLAGKIDLILTKSVSRFARNTVDTLIHVRQLKDKGVEVYFEKENIWTLDSKGELLITIMSSLTQEESRSISENVTWDHRKRFADGKIMVPYASLLGYKKGEDGNLASTKPKHQPSVVFMPASSKAQPHKPSPKNSHPMASPPRVANKSGRPPLCGRSLPTRNTKATRCCKRASPPTS